MIHFDNRAGSAEFPTLPPLTTLPTEIYQFSDLNIPGDCYFRGNGPTGDITIGIEIKSLHDLVGSLDSGRLQGEGTSESRGQLIRMLKYFDITLLIYYGNYFPDDGNFIRYFTQSGANLIGRIQLKLRSKRGDFHRWLATLPRILSLGSRKSYWHGLQAALEELQCYGIHVHRVNDKHEVARLIAALYDFYSKPWAKHKLFRAFNTAAVIQPSTRIAQLDTTPHHIRTAAKFLLGSDKLGYERALAIAHHFNGDIEVMFRTIANDPDALTDIRTGKHRIGPVISNSVHETVRSKVPTLDVDALIARLKV